MEKKKNHSLLPACQIQCSYKQQEQLQNLQGFHMLNVGT